MHDLQNSDSSSKRSATRTPKFIFVSGGVLSGLGKGIAAASIGHLLSKQYTVVPIKCDGYLNTDPGTMNPAEHGEVFVLNDGSEVDMDFGHYERFMGTACDKNQTLTMGKVFKAIEQKERRGDYLGKTVQFIPHVTDFIKEHFKQVARDRSADIVFVEIGGTIGDFENELFVEAARQLSLELPSEDSMFIHLTYVPFLDHVKEQKSKPTQMSVRQLLERGIRPDIIIARCRNELEPNIKKKIALFCNVREEAVISGFDVDTVYSIPQNFAQQGILQLISKKLSLPIVSQEDSWPTLVENLRHPTQEIRIALAGKYLALEDSYASVIEAVKHCAAQTKTKITLKFIDTTNLTNEHVAAALADVHGVIVPGGFGTRGIEGKIAIITYCRENKIPYLGLCLGLQLAVIEFARNVCGLAGATSQEFDANSSTQVIAYLPGQNDDLAKGGTMRLGMYEAVLLPSTHVSAVYDDASRVQERHRHRYEVNPKYHDMLQSHGLTFAGMSPDGTLVEFISLESHPYFVATQAHPELISKLEKPAPLFFGLVKAAIERMKKSSSDLQDMSILKVAVHKA